MPGFVRFDPAPRVARTFGRVLLRVGNRGVHRQRPIHQAGGDYGRGQHL